MDYLDYIRQQYLKEKHIVDEWKKIHCKNVNNLQYNELERKIIDNTEYYSFDTMVSSIKVELNKLDKIKPYYLLFPHIDMKSHSEHLFVIECLEEIKSLNIIDVITTPTLLPDDSNVLCIDDMVFTGLQVNNNVKTMCGDNQLNITVVCGGTHNFANKMINLHGNSKYKFTIVPNFIFYTFHEFLTKPEEELFRTTYDILWLAPIVMQHKLPNQTSSNLVLYNKALKNIPTRVPINLLTSIMY